MNKPNRVTAGILAIFLGGLGVHLFYVGKTLRGLLYLVFCWTFIPAFLAFLEGIMIFANNDDWFDKSYLKSADHFNKEEVKKGGIALLAFFLMWQFFQFTLSMGEQSEKELRERQNLNLQNRIQAIKNQATEPNLADTNNKIVNEKEEIKEVVIDPKKPTEHDLYVRKRINDLHVEMNMNSEAYVSEAEIYRMLAPELGMTEKELEDINWKVASYYMERGVFDF